MARNNQKKKGVKKQVKKRRYNGGGFDEHPEHINPEGRPETPWTWRELFMKIAEEKKKGKLRKEIAAQAQWAEMEKGNVKAFEKIADRMEGKALEKIDHTTQGEKIEGFRVEYVSAPKRKDS